MDNKASDIRFDDEVSLIDLWNLLMRRKWLVIVVTLACLAAAAVYAFTAKKVFGSEVDVALASTVPIESPDVNLYVTSPEVITKRLKAKQHIVDNALLAWVSDADLAKERGERPDVLSIQVRGDSPEHARQFAAKLGKDLVASQNAAVDARVQQLTAYRDGLKADLRSVRDLLADPARNRPRDAMRARAELLQASADLQAKIENADRQMSASYLKRAEIVSEPTLNKSAVQPKTKLILAAALFGGLMLAFLLVVFVEFLARAREQGR